MVHFSLTKMVTRFPVGKIVMIATQHPTRLQTMAIAMEPPQQMIAMIQTLILPPYLKIIHVMDPLKQISSRIQTVLPFFVREQMSETLVL